MPTFNDARIRKANERPIATKGKYVLYWMQMSRRLTHNHALDYAIACAKNLNKPLVVYEGLKLNYPWANARIHQFMLEGMRENALAAKRMGINYWPFVETPERNGRGLVKSLVADACLLVTDDYPAYIVPAHNRAIAERAPCPVHLVDGNGMIPLSMLGPTVTAAAHLRPRIHKLFAECWSHRASAEPDFPKGRVDPPFETWTCNDVTAFVKSLPIVQSVAPIPAKGGARAGRDVLGQFVANKLDRYGTERNHPDDPANSSASTL